jgi:hypothetical protein
MGKPKETSGAKQKTLLSFFGPGQGSSKPSSSFPTGVTQSETKKSAPVAPRFAENPQVDVKAAESNKEGVQPPVAKSGSRSRAVTVSSITTMNTPPSSDIVMCGDDDGEVEEEYRPVSTAAGPLMASADRNSQTRLKRKLVIDSETETESSPAFKKKSTANSSSFLTHDKKYKSTSPRSPIPVQNIL